jgi:diketogulonate reductase-like aldo/keto reductase
VRRRCFADARDPDVVAIAKSVTPRRIEDNLRAAQLRLSPEELEQIDQAFPLRFGTLRQSRIFRHTHAALHRLIHRRR